MNSSGFDPSLFHDDDGRKWLVNMRWNHRETGTGQNPAHDRFDGIELQEWHPERGLIGPKHDIYAGTDLGLTEAPHLFKRGGWYFLTLAEGGTGYDHAVTMARSRSITGPYETHPQKHLLTARFAPDSPLQRTGHGQYVETPEGEAYHTYLVGRPLTGPRGTFCALGRETGIAACEWRADGWLYLKGGGLLPPVSVPMDAVTLPDLALSRDFSGPELPPEFQWLRTPEPGRIFALTGQALRMVGRESLGSWFEQSLLARRQEHHAYHAAAVFHADPPSWQQAIGLTTYYNRTKFHAALITREPGIGRCLRLMSCLGDWPGEALTLSAPVPLPAQDIRLEVRVTGARQQFYWATVAGNAQPFGPELDASLISDEGGRGEHASFTGAFVGMVAYDMTGQGWSAEVTRFDYSPLTLREQA